MAAVGSDSTQIEFRIAAITSILAHGGVRSDCIRYASEQGWGVTTRTVENYIAKAREDIKSDWELERPQLIAQMLTRLQRYERKAEEKGELTTAIQSVITQAKLVQVL